MRIAEAKTQHLDDYATDAVDCLPFQAAALQDEGVPTRVLIAPWGEVVSSAGTFIVDEQGTAEAIEAFLAHATDLPVDYEHQTLGGAYSAPNGLAPAAGWIKALHIVSAADAARANSPIEPGLWADVEWTADAAVQLREKQYRYLSPVALVRRDDRRLIGLHSVALTNKPAIVGMKPVVNRHDVEAGRTARSSLVSDSDDAAADAMSPLRCLLNLDESATEDIILVAATAKIRTLEHTSKLRDASDRVAAALSEGRLAPSQREWAMALALHDPIEFERWRSAAPRVVALGRLSPPGDVAVPHAHRAVEATAREEYRANRQMLGRLCTEAAYVSDALRCVNLPERIA